MRLEVKRLGITTIIVEQNAVAALELADRCIILETGAMAFVGAAHEVLSNAELQRTYLALQARARPTRRSSGGPFLGGHGVERYWRMPMQSLSSSHILQGNCFAW